ncbi:MAG: hypothetical protein PVH40_03170, partial [Gemmatimonadales bacterium]
NELRLHYAEMVARIGGLSCAFNSTVFEDTLDVVPEMVEWAQQHIDIVHVMVFICYRAAVLEGDFDYFLGGDRLDMSQLVYGYGTPEHRTDIRAPDVVAKIRERYPDFAPCAYLNGTEKPDSFKWLLTTRIGTKDRIYGYHGARAAELTQTMHHLRHGRYLAYAHPRILRRGRSMLWLWPLDPAIRKAAARVVRDPRVLFRRLHQQSIMIIQPVDVFEDGRQNMCDGCPDMTVFDGRLVWSCRLEECLHFGGFARTAPKKRSGNGDRALHD